MAARFRLVKYYNLPRIYGWFIGEIHLQMDYEQGYPYDLGKPKI